MSHYPTIFVHGFGGWGEKEPMNKLMGYWGKGKNDILAHLRAEGYECYAPSLGPVTGVWDRCCELWAYLFGGTVDYGKVHSEKYGHARYGRTYEHGVLEDLGKTEAHKKINIVGHSFGGPTVKGFAALMCQGSQEEIDGTDPDDLSPLFQGGHGNLLNAVHTLSGVNNGTTLDVFSDKSLPIAAEAILIFIASLGNAAVKLWDHGLQFYGIGDYPEKQKLPLPALKRSWPGVKKFAATVWDGAQGEMRIEVQHDMNEVQQTNEKIYYFAHRALASKTIPGGWQIPDIGRTKFSGGRVGADMIGLITGNVILKKYKTGELGYTIDKSWLPSDGFVNVIGQSAPLNAPQEDGSLSDDFAPKAGVWYNMPVQRADHLVWMLMTGTREEVFAYYDRMMKLNDSLPET